MKRLLITLIIVLCAGAAFGQKYPKVVLRDTLVVPTGADTTMTITLGEYWIETADPVGFLFDYRSLTGIADTAAILDLGYCRSTSDTMYVRFSGLPYYLCDTVNSLTIHQLQYVTRGYIRIKLTNDGATAGEKVVVELTR